MRQLVQYDASIKPTAPYYDAHEVNQRLLAEREQIDAAEIDERDERIAALEAENAALAVARCGMVPAPAESRYTMEQGKIMHSALIELSTLGGGRSQGNEIAQTALKRLAPKPKTPAELCAHCGKEIRKGALIYLHVETGQHECHMVAELAKEKQ